MPGAWDCQSSKALLSSAVLRDLAPVGYSCCSRASLELSYETGLDALAGFHHKLSM